MKKLLILIAVCFVFVSCKGSAAPDQKTIIFDGVYRNELHFKAEITHLKDYYEVKIKDSDGKLLLDMEIPPSGEVTYDYISPLPVNTVYEFEDFFNKYVYKKDAADIKKESGKVYYYIDNTAILYLQE